MGSISITAPSTHPASKANTQPIASVAAARRPSRRSPTVAASASPIVGPSSGAMIIAPITTATCPLRMPSPAMMADSVTVSR